jgi:hypothetical protein
MEPECSLPCLQKPVTPLSLRTILILSSRLCLCLPSCLFLSAFPTETQQVFHFSSMHAACPAQLNQFHLSFQLYLVKSTSYEDSH